jgi:putative endonuclease
VNMFFVYALYSSKFNKIYIGQTVDLDKRLTEHNAGLSFYTKRFMPWEIVYTEKIKTRTEAMKREKQLKSQKGREFIWNHIRKENTAGL